MGKWGLGGGRGGKLTELASQITPQHSIAAKSDFSRSWLVSRCFRSPVNHYNYSARKSLDVNHNISTGGGGGGFFFACENFERMFDHSFPACAFFFFFFFEAEMSPRTLFPFVMPGSVHGCSASWDDRGRIFPDKLRVSSFPDRFPHYAWTAA